MPSAAQRSASQYQVKMHSTATTRSSRYGAIDVQERFGVRRQVLVDEDLAVAVEDADVHRLGVQIDAAVVAMLARVESHWFSPCADARVLDQHPAYSGWSRRRERPRMRIKGLQLTTDSWAFLTSVAFWRRTSVAWR